MGIKTRFNPMGGISDSDKGKLSDWRYSNLANGSTLLYEYVGAQTTLYAWSYSSGDWGAGQVTPIYTLSSSPSVGDSALNSSGSPIYTITAVSGSTISISTKYGTSIYTRASSSDISISGLYPDVVYVPKVKGKAVINNYTSGTTTTASNTPFYNNPNVKNVDLQNVPYVNNSMDRAFYNCRYLTSVNNINKNVTSMYGTFGYCTNLNQNIQIPNSVTNMYLTFRDCYNLNQNIQIPNSVTDMAYTFYYCQNLRQNIQIPNSVTNMANTFAYCYNLNQPIQIPNSVTNMSRTFDYCYKLNQNIQIGNSVTNMAGTFFRCSNLNQNIQIGNSVTNMGSTFSDCTSLNQNIQIPNSVTDMGETFYNCYNLNQPITIGSSVTYMYATFMSCTNLNQNIQIGNSVTYMGATFRYCTSLNQNIRIPNSVTNMGSTFSDCTSLNQNIQIPSSVTAIGYTFYNCANLKGTITIDSANISGALNCFYGSGLTKNVIFPLRYINNVNTLTRNTLVTAATGGYAVGTCIGNLVNNTAQNAVFKAYDFVSWEGFNTWTGNGTHWLLNKWAGIGKAAGTTTVTVPNSINSYATYPTAMTYTCFTGNTTITSVTLPDYIPWATQMGNYKNSKSRYGAFNQCTNLREIHAKINSEVTVADEVFTNCFNLRVANINFAESSLTRCTDLFCRCYNLTSYTHPLPTTLTSMWSTFYMTNLSQSSITIPYQVTTMATCFSNCSRVPDNIYIDSPKVSNIVNTFRARPTANRTNIHIYFVYSNGVNTPTYNSFKANNVYKGTSGNAAGTNPMYNSTSNIYVYNRGKSPYS